MSEHTSAIAHTSGHRLFTLGKGGRRVVRVQKGEINLFITSHKQGQEQPWRHFADIGNGGWIFDLGFERLPEHVEVFGTAQPDAQWDIVEIKDLPPTDIAEKLEAWEFSLLQAIMRIAEEEETDSTVFLQHGPVPAIKSAEILGIRHGLGWWDTRQAHEVIYLMKRPEEGTLLPLIPRLGVLLVADVSESEFLTSDAFVRRTDWPERLSQTQIYLSSVLERALGLQEARELRETASRKVLAQSREADAWGEIAGVLDTTPSAAQATMAGSIEPTHTAFQRVAAYMGIELPAASKPVEADSMLEGVALLTRQASIRWRQVLLTGRWYKHNHGAMIATLGSSQEAVALIPVGSRRYALIRNDGSSEKVTPALAAEIGLSAACLYRSLPSRKLKLKDIFSFALSGSVGDFTMVMAMVIVTGLLGVATPALSARIYDVIIPQSERGLMVQITLILISAALIGGLFELVRGIAMLRIENRADSQLQAAIWDRLLKLPSGFFRKFTAGDLADRAQGISEAHQVLATTGASVLFTLPVGLFNLLVMFYYSWPLALWGFGVALAGVALSVGLSVAQILIMRKQYAIRGELAGLVYQLISGVGKLRIANAEAFAFATWARVYAKQEKLSVKSGKWGVASQTFFSGFSLLTTGIIFGLVAHETMKPDSVAHTSFTTGSFLAFYSAFGALIGSLITASHSSLSLLQLFPILERTKPIFEAEPEITEARSHPGELAGEIEMTGVKFSYSEDTPPVLNGLSLKINPGEMVAVVGPSGCGKSTLLRLLLGFETPNAGSIFYDGKDLQTLDLREVRRQIGVVLQTSRLITGDIYRNIVGESNLTIEDAWEAAEMAGVAADIRAMPMQMFTMISEGGGGFSGGQKQRLAIARAFAHRPRLIFFDEATSALDNRTQAIVSESMENLLVTRIVIAHRLSTIVKADRIITMQDGRIVEEGTYEELMAREGYFHSLAKRQLA